jgi:diaminopimelate decarboxylase
MQLRLMLVYRWIQFHNWNSLEALIPVARCLQNQSGVGAGHHEKVTTGGQKTKFGIETIGIPELKIVQVQSETHWRNQHMVTVHGWRCLYLSTENILSVWAVLSTEFG